MFMMVDTGHCPACCTAGRRMKMPDVFVCPSCMAVFGEFGIIINPQEGAGEQQMA